MDGVEAGGGVTCGAYACVWVERERVGRRSAQRGAVCVAARERGRAAQRECVAVVDVWDE